MQPIEVHSSADWRIEAEVHDDFGAAIDLTGTPLQGKITLCDGSLVATLATGSGIEVLDAEAGLILVSVNAADRTLPQLTKRTLASVDVFRLADQGGPDQRNEWTGRFFIEIEVGG